MSLYLTKDKYQRFNADTISANLSGELEDELAQIAPPTPVTPQNVVLPSGDELLGSFQNDVDHTPFVPPNMAGGPPASPPALEQSAPLPMAPPASSPSPDYGRDIVSQFAGDIMDLVAGYGAQQRAPTSRAPLSPLTEAPVGPVQQESTPDWQAQEAAKWGGQAAESPYVGVTPNRAPAEPAEVLGRGNQLVSDFSRDLADLVIPRPVADAEVPVIGGRVGDLAGDIINPVNAVAGEALGRVAGAGIKAAAGSAPVRAAADTIREGAEKLPATLAEYADSLKLPSLTSGQPAEASADFASGGMRRFFHGTGDAFDSPNPAKFDENGLFGPAYYVTDDPRVAASYADTRSPIVDGAASRIEAARSNIAYGKDVLARVAAKPSPDDAGYVAKTRQMIAESESELARLLDVNSGGNVRPVDVPRGLNLLDVDTPAGKAIWDEVAEPPRITDRGGRWTGEYEVPDKRSAVAELARRGYDGIRYAGGKRVPLKADDGSDIEHVALAIFPESLGKIRNALSGRAGGAASAEFGSTLGGGATGGLGAAATTDPDDPNRGAKIAAGAAAGALAGMGAARFAGRGAPPSGPTTALARAADAGTDLAKTGAAKGDGTMGDLDDITAMWQRNRDSRSPLNRIREAVSTIPEAVERQVADRFADINRLAGSNAEEAVALFQGRAGAAMQRIKDEYTPLYETLRGKASNGATQLDNFNTYVKLNRDLEVANAKGTAGGLRRSSAGGTGAARAQQLLVEMQERLSPDEWGAIVNADKIRQQALDSMLDEKARSGLISNEMREWLLREYPHYNPTVAMQNIEKAAGQVMGIGKKLNQPTNTMRRLMEDGATADTEEPLLSALRHTLQGDVATRRNDAIRTIIHGLESNGIEGVERLKTAAPDAKGALSFWENGQRVSYKVPETVERAAKAMDDTSLSAATRIFMATGRGINAPLRVGATALSPAFVVTNALADAVTTFIKEGAKTTAKIPKMYVEAARQGPLYQKYMRAGGSMDGYFGGDADDIEKMVQNAGGLLVKDTAFWKRLLYATRDLATLKPITKAGQVIELGPRLASFERNLERGKTVGQAALDGRRVTIDFARGGEAVKLANSWVLFLNARAQGTLNMGRLMRDNPAARWRLASVAGTAAATYAWNRQFPEYADVPDYIKDGNMVVMLPGSEKDPDGPGYKKLNYIAIPLREWSVFASPLIKQMENMDGTDPRGWDEFAGSLARSMTPISGETATSAVGGMIPALARTPIEVDTNTKFFTNSPIVSRRFEGLPPSAQRDDRSSAVSKLIADNVGGSPKGIDFAINENLGGLGRVITGEPNPFRGVVKNSGGQLEEDAYAELDRRFNGQQEARAREVRAMPEYQRATPDRQNGMLKIAMDDLREDIKAELGIQSNPADKGLPERFRGVTDKKEEARIGAAISKVNAYERDPRNAPRPSADERRLASRYEGRVNPAYTRAQREQESENRAIRAR
jgi:hypothetical protein